MFGCPCHWLRRGIYRFCNFTSFAWRDDGAREFTSVIFSASAYKFTQRSAGTDSAIHMNCSNGLRPIQQYTIHMAYCYCRHKNALHNTRTHVQRTYLIWVRASHSIYGFRWHLIAIEIVLFLLSICLQLLWPLNCHSPSELEIILPSAHPFLFWQRQRQEEKCAANDCESARAWNNVWIFFFMTSMTTWFRTNRLFMCIRRTWHTIPNQSTFI